MSAGAHRPRLVMLLSNAYEPDVRAQKEAHMLALAGYDVTVIGWDRALAHPARATESIPARLDTALAGWSGRCVDTPEPVSIVRVRVPAGWRRGPWHLLPKVPPFWWRLFQEARRARPAVVHAHQLDTLPVAYALGRLYGVPVVYDAREYYAGMLVATSGRLISRALEQVDRWLTPRASAVLAVGERQAARHREMGGRVWIVHNSQPPPNGDAAAVDGHALRRSLDIPDAALLVVYIGNFTDDRLLTPVLEAVTRLDDVFLVIGGDGPQASLVQAAAAACPRIHALGRVPLARVGDIVAAGDVVYYGLNPGDPNSFYFMPNLGFFALAAGRPLLVTPVGEIADVVRHEACGLVMETATGAAAEAALRRLRDDALRATLAARARRLGETAFHVRCAATQLLAAYASVSSFAACTGNGR
jgi:glycosyltransferase involved in cell wall biosynthesis